MKPPAKLKLHHDFLEEIVKANTSTFMRDLLMNSSFIDTYLTNVLLSNPPLTQPMPNVRKMVLLHPTRQLRQCGKDALPHMITLILLTNTLATYFAKKQCIKLKHKSHPFRKSPSPSCQTVVRSRKISIFRPLDLFGYTLLVIS